MSGSSRSRATDRKEVKGDHSRGSALLSRVPLYLSRVGRAGMGVDTGPIYSPGVIK